MNSNIDQWLIDKIFQPIAGWVNRKFWINNYFLGAGFCRNAAFMELFNGMAMPLILNKHHTATFWVIYSVTSLMTLILGIFFYLTSYILDKMGKDYERNPDQLPKHAIGFQSGGKLWWIVWGSMIFVLSFMIYDGSIFVQAMDSFFSANFFFYGCGRYFAACLTPPAKRDRKKITDVSFNPLPQGV